VASSFDMLTALCSAVGVLPLGGGVALGLLLTGAAGSAAHCVPMCGGFVLGQVADRMTQLSAARMCEWRRLSTAALVPYHLGRLTTYAGLGAVAGSFGAAFGLVPWLGWASSILLLLAALLFLAHAARRLAPRLVASLPALDRAPAGWNRLLAAATGRLDRSNVRGGFLLGVTLGFLPCGFLYAALAATAATADPAMGAVAMAAFGLGTFPALLAVGVAGHAVAHRWRRGMAVMAPAVMLLNAALLILLALRGFTISA
jgi:sulfite exporter TauE/SafE